MARKEKEPEKGSKARPNPAETILTAWNPEQWSAPQAGTVLMPRDEIRASGSSQAGPGEEGLEIIEELDLRDEIRDDAPLGGAGHARTVLGTLRTSAPPKSFLMRHLPWIAGGAIVLAGLGTWAFIHFRPAPDEGRTVASQAMKRDDVPLALRSYFERAQAGDPSAMRMIGVLYYNGLEVPRNREEGLKWYRKAAAAGSRTAQEELKSLQGSER